MERESAYRLVTKALEQRGHGPEAARECAEAAVDVLLNSGQVVLGETHRALMTLLNQASARVSQLTSEVERLRREPTG